MTSSSAASLARIGALLTMLTLPSTVSASLGGNLSSVDADRVHVEGALMRMVRSDTYTLHEIRSATGTTIRDKAYSRPLKSGIIAIKLKEDDELIDCAITKTGDEIVLSTATGMAIRFHQSDARPMGRNTSGVKGISLGKGDHLVGMVVADPEATLFTACEHGYGKRTPFGPNSPQEPQAEGEGASEIDDDAEPAIEHGESASADGEEGEGETSSGFRYRTQRRGGKGLRDIKTTERNGPVVSIVPVKDDDELMMMTARGKIQRVKVSDFNIIGRNTQGVRIMSLDEGDALAAIVRVPQEEQEEGDLSAEAPSPADESDEMR